MTNAYILLSVLLIVLSEERKGIKVNCHLTDLRHKEVISSCDGRRVGFVDDVIIDTKTARIVSIVIFGRSGFLGIFGRCEDYIIPWEKIDLIGQDTIIISCTTPKPIKRQRKSRFWDKS